MTLQRYKLYFTFANKIDKQAYFIDERYKSLIISRELLKLLLYKLGVFILIFQIKSDGFVYKPRFPIISTFIASK